ncbi:MAG: hypothetical protein GF308_20765 [Candidatus Heimdallarchaeota archaeon]|nr:hypothetical protein [Candidatus Heimdallarchaeota archaeon]
MSLLLRNPLEKWSNLEREINIDEDFVFAFTNYVVYHRGQINIALKIVGEKTNDADYGDYQRQRNKT